MTHQHQLKVQKNVAARTHFPSFATVEYYYHLKTYHSSPSPTDVGALTVQPSMVSASQTLVIALRGFKVRPQTLDKFLAMNGDVHGTENGKSPPFYKYDDLGAASDKMSDILRARVTAIHKSSESGGILVAVPCIYPHDRSPWVYVAYSHTFVYSQRLITTDDFEKEAPRAFEQLRQEILECSSSPDELDEGLMGFYIINIWGQDGPKPAELKDRSKVFILYFLFRLAGILGRLEQFID